MLGTTAKSKALVTMWERRAELDGFAPVMEGVRNAAAGLKGRALSGPHAYNQIPELIERSKQRAANFAANALKMPIPAEHTAFQRWYDEVSARPSAAA